MILFNIHPTDNKRIGYSKILSNEPKFTHQGQTEKGPAHKAGVTSDCEPPVLGARNLTFVLCNSRTFS